MIFFKYIIFGLFFSYVKSQTNVTASVDINRISQSETIGFKILTVNADGTPNVDISPIQKDFNIVSGPAQQTNIQWVNGAMTSSRSLSWTLLPKRSGKLNIPSLKVKIANQIYTTKPIGISVAKTAGRADLADLFIEVKPDKEEVYSGEQLTVTYRLFTRLNLSIEDIEYPKSVGFWNEDLRVSQTVRFRDTQINGVAYKVATLYKSAMFPTQTGKLTIAPMTAICNVEKPSKRRSRGLFDDPFFNSMFRESQRKFIQSDSLTINVLPYPNSPPVNFTGAVGQFDIEAWVDSQNVKINEAVTFHLKLFGSGNINQFNIEPINFPQNMEVFPPSSTFSRDEFRDLLTGEQKFEYILIPRMPGSFRINPINLTYFDPDKDRFITKRSNPIDITVTPGGNIENVSTKYGKEDIAILGEDIRYIRTKTSKWYRRDDQSIPIWVFNIYLLSFGFFVFPFAFNVFKEKQINTSGVRQAKNALPLALKSLNKKVEDPFSYTISIINHYFKSKLFLSTTNLDGMTLEKQLSGKVNEKLIIELILIIKICDSGRFSPDSSKKMNTIQADALDLLKRIDNELS